MILGGLFVVGIVGGYFYYVGQFDPYLVAYAFEQMPKVTPEEAAKQVDANATPEAANRDLGAVDKRFVRWRGQLSETRSLSPELSALTMLTSDSPRRVAVIFYKRPLQTLEARLGDEVEVIGLLRRTLVMSEDREGHRYPQVLALSIAKVEAKTPPVPDSHLDDGEETSTERPASAAPSVHPR